jgi:hypothetical protein
MSDLKIGDWVRLTGPGWTEVSVNRSLLYKILGVSSVDPEWGTIEGDWEVTTSPLASEWLVEVVEDGGTLAEELGIDPLRVDQFLETVDKFKGSSVEPDFYKFPSGAEVKDISGYLTGFASQALQYIARSSRIDGKNKGNTVEDLEKAITFLRFEIERLKSDTA